MQNDMIYFSDLSPEQVNHLVITLQTKLEERDEALKKAQEKIDALTHQVASLQKMLFGKKSERYVDDGTPLLPGLVLPETSNPDPAQEISVGAHPRKKAEPHREAGWNGFPENLPREEVVLDLPEAEKKGLELIGYDVN